MSRVMLSKDENWSKITQIAQMILLFFSAFSANSAVYF